MLILVIYFRVRTSANMQVKSSGNRCTDFMAVAVSIQGDFIPGRVSHEGRENGVCSVCHKFMSLVTSTGILTDLDQQLI